MYQSGDADFRAWYPKISAEIIGKQISENNYNVVAVVHAETSTGVRNPVEEMSKYMDDKTLFIVDAVTSFGTIELKVDDWNIDAVYSCSQKGLSCPPGASPVTFSSNSIS